jgi:L-aminopeptidase/D-esterase-like protein
VVGALVACNAVGDVLDPATGQVIAGARTADGQSLLDTQAALLRGERSTRPMPGTNTTIGVVATNATLSKAQAKRLAMSAHDGLARTIRPAHTTLDGDTLFALATCTETAAPDVMLRGGLKPSWATSRRILIGCCKSLSKPKLISLSKLSIYPLTSDP